jgi:hypothetical protein
MLRRTLGVVVLVASSLATFGPAVVAQADGSHPARIQAGACPGVGAVVAALGDISAAGLVDGVSSASATPVGLGSAVPVATSVTTIPVALADLVTTGHSLVVTRSASDPAVIACGDIGGRTLGTADLPIGLGAIGDSGLTGVASLHDVGNGTTTVTAYLVSGGAPAVAPSPSSAPTSTTVTFGTSLYFAGFDIVVQDVTYDRAAATLTVDATYHNTATAPASLGTLSGGQLWISWADTVIDLPPPDGTVPADTTVQATTVGYVPEGFVMDDAVLTFGLPGYHQATLPLVAGSVATFEAPVVVDVTKTVRAKKYATFKVTGAEAVPALCNGNISGFVFLPAPVNVASIVLTVTVTGGTAIGVGGLGLGGSFATGPDGLSGPGDLGTPVLGPRQTIRDGTYCFPVTAPVHGKHKITFLTAPAKASLNITVP